MLCSRSLGYGHGAVEIIQAISKLHGICHALDIPTVCVAIPPNRFADPVMEPAYHKAWEDVNFTVKVRSFSLFGGEDLLPGALCLTPKKKHQKRG